MKILNNYNLNYLIFSKTCFFNHVRKHTIQIYFRNYSNALQYNICYDKLLLVIKYNYIVSSV